MEYVRLGDFCEITSSKRVYAHQYTSDGVPFYRSREIIERREHKDITEGLYISSDLYNTFKHKFGVPQKGDILLTSVGTLGIPYLVGEEVFYFKDGNLTWMRNFNESLLSKYLFYWFNSKFGKDSLITRAIGSSQAALTIDILKKYKFILPSINVQQTIISILSSYDELIENNNKRIKILEQMAENLYKEWFVRFRFPGYEQAEFENGIPKGWKVKRLSDGIAQVAAGGDRPDIFSQTKTENCSVPIFSNGIDDYGLYGYTNQPRITQDSVTVSARGTVGFVCLREEPYVPIVRLLSIIPNADEISAKFLYFALRTSNLEGNGTSQQQLTVPMIGRKRLLIPDKHLIRMFTGMVDLMFSQRKKLIEINQNCTRQRDLLLPRLMSGKLEV